MIKILLVEKNLILSSTLNEHLNKDEQINVVNICKEGNQALEFLKENSVDVVIMDFLQTNGLVVTQQISHNYPDVKIIGFSTYESDDYPNQMIKLGADKCLSKYSTTMQDLLDELKKTVREHGITVVK